MVDEEPVEGDSEPITKASNHMPWWESNLLWVPFALGVGTLLTVVAAMKHDLRWLLIFAWICFVVAVWVGSRRFRRVWWIVATAGILLCSLFLFMNWWLRPAMEASLSVNPPKQNAMSQQEATTTTTPAAPTKTTKNPAAIVKPHQSVPVITPPPMQQSCEGGNCAQSSGQQGGVTAGQINIGTPPPSEVQLVSVYKNRPHTYVQEGSTRTTIQGFESQYKVRVTGQQVPEVKVFVRHPTFIHIDCDRIIPGTMQPGTGAAGSGVVSCSIQDAYSSVGTITIFTTTELPKADDFLAYQCIGTPCNAVKPLESE